MRKEFIVAVFLGLTVGLLIVVGMLVARQAFKKHQAKPEIAGNGSPLVSTAATPSSPASPTPAPSKHVITIDQPENNSVVSSNELIVSGKTTPKSTVAVAAEKNEYFAEADEAGLFSQKIELINGVNEIKMSAVSPSGEQAEITLTIVYTTAEF